MIAKSPLRRPDPRLLIAAILLAYLILGFTVLGFNRTPIQALVTTISACALEVALARLFKKRWILPLSAMITSFSLSILLNYAHDYALLMVPVFFAIGSKYIFTYEGRHLLNPALAGVSFSLLFSSGLITAAPAYQWNGIASMSAFMVALGVVLILPSVKRGPLVLSFLVSFTLLTALRAVIMRWHLPFETLFLGTLSSPAFLLFAFFMITDPATSPSDRRSQIATGIALAVIDLLFHIRQSYFTFFYAALSLALFKLVYLHLRTARQEGLAAYIHERRSYWLRPLALGMIAIVGTGVYRGMIAPSLDLQQLAWRLEKIEPERSGISPQMGKVLTRMDPRIHHVAKWIFSVGDAVAVGDYDGDGLQDLFFTFSLKRDEDRAALYRNLGGFRFQRVALPAIKEKTRALETEGIASGGMFVDYDSDGDQDLLITYACGSPILLKNHLEEEGRPRFSDVTKSVGLDGYTNSMGANFLDINRDGRLDLVMGNVLSKHLPGYEQPTRLNLFALPKPEHEGDERMFNFMHSSWHMSNNGGENEVYLQTEAGRFEKRAALKLPQTRWTLAIGTGDLNQDGFTDLYVANDFGPDDLYFNDRGERWINHKGSMFGSIGKDTYKGMNASLGDVDNNGWLDVYVSNVHHALQAEGSLLWTFEAGAQAPKIQNRATPMAALNENRFGWGATMADLDNDGWLDIAQANGMVDDTIDKRFEDCPDYWYVNEKIARSAPSIHSFANKWGDIRGFCIYGQERNRIYLNRKGPNGRRFVDAAQALGVTARTNSRGIAAVDLDNDGRRDLVITHQFAAPTIYRNRPETSSVNPNAWIGLELEGDGRRCHRGAVGSTVRIGEQMREVQVVNGFSSQDDRRLHFGLGERRAPVDVEVLWCGQERRVYRGLVPGRYHRLAQFEDN